MHICIYVHIYIYINTFSIRAMRMTRSIACIRGCCKEKRLASQADIPTEIEVRGTESAMSLRAANSVESCRAIVRNECIYEKVTRIQMHP